MRLQRTTQISVSFDYDCEIFLIFSISVPIGFVYIQYPWQLEPKKLWPNFNWILDNDKYQGAFFRSSMSNESWECLQEQNSYKITQLEHIEARSSGHKQIDIIPGRWSQSLKTSSNIITNLNNGSIEHSIKIFFQDGEVRPKNYGIKIWRRIF